MRREKMSRRRLVLEDGTVFEGTGFGDECDTHGELIFNTGMTGYQEILSDPSYYGQLVVMTTPEVGNYGINRDDFEAVSPAIKGLIVREFCNLPNNFRSVEDLNTFLKAHHIPGVANIDTRMLAKHIRKSGTLRGSIIDLEIPIETAIQKLADKSKQTNDVEKVSTKQAYVIPGRGLRIVVIDLGMKHGILRELTERHCQVTVVPHDYKAEQISRLNPSGVLITNGPGNPKNLFATIKTIQDISDHIPLLGIGLGHQVMALAFGADTEKMLFGHHGSNHPVKDLGRNKAFVTTQNHNYAVKEESLENTDLEVTHRALNDGTVEGINHLYYPAFSVQFQPEGGPGPEDTYYIFDQFLNLIQHHEETNKEDLYAEKY